MKLTLKNAVMTGKGQFLPGTVIDTVEHGISDVEAEVLIGRAVAEIHDEVPTPPGDGDSEGDDEGGDGDTGDEQPAPKKKAKAPKAD